MKRPAFLAVTILVVLAAAVAGAADTRTYDHPLESTWDEAVKAVRDADMVLLDSSRSDHTFTMRTKSWHSTNHGCRLTPIMHASGLFRLISATSSRPELCRKASSPHHSGSCTAWPGMSLVAT